MDTLKGQCFDTEKLELLVWKVMEMVGYKFRTMEGVVDHVTKLLRFFSIFFSLVYFTIYLSSWMSLTIVFEKCT